MMIDMVPPRIRRHWVVFWNYFSTFFFVKSCERLGYCDNCGLLNS